MNKRDFEIELQKLAAALSEYTSSPDGQWAVKGFIDIYRNIFTISSDTKIISKILEIHLFSQVLSFANSIGFDIVLADHQNYYPDLSFVKKSDSTVKYAVDFKTTYRLLD